MTAPLTHTDLKTKQRELRGGFPETMGLRVHRAISWIGRAEAADGDHDAQFIFLWIAFNASYADEEEFQGSSPSARTTFNSFFEKLVDLDSERTIYDAIWEKFPGPIRLLMGNKFVFNPFWQHHNGIDGFDNWEEQFKRASESFRRHVKAQNTAQILSFVFDRLYVLRNQLVHGGSTWNSSVNREQVRDGASILGFLMPAFIDIMMDNVDQSWGRPFYPVVE